MGVYSTLVVFHSVHRRLSYPLVDWIILDGTEVLYLLVPNAGLCGLMADCYTY